jgi:hypothetical protein
MAIQDKLDIKLNQNLWMLLVALISLGCAEYFKLTRLVCFANYLCWISCISITITLLVYTYNYVKNKLFNSK